MEAEEISKGMEGIEKIGKAMKNDFGENDKQMPKWELALRALFVIVLMVISAYLFFFARDFNDVLRCIGGAVSLVSAPAAFTINLRHESVKARVDKGNLLSSAQNEGNMCASKLASSDHNGTTIIGDNNNVSVQIDPLQGVKMVNQDVTDFPKVVSTQTPQP